jgi:hypothetical protein
MACPLLAEIRFVTAADIITLRAETRNHRLQFDLSRKSSWSIASDENYFYTYSLG